MQEISGLNYVFSKDNEVSAKAKSGEILLFKTEDCYGGQIHNESQLMANIDFNYTNPTAGPVVIEGAKDGDTLKVEILDIKVNDQGASCSIAEIGPLADISETRTRVIKIKDGFATFQGVSWQIDPMIGVIGTAPREGSIATGLAGDHGGNMDSKKITKGATVYLPVRTEGAYLQMGDLHASMGDGEVSGTGLEVSGEIVVRVTLIKDFKLNWPVVETKDKWYVNSTDPVYGKALVLAAKELARLMKPAYGWDETDIFIYLSLQGDVEINQGVAPISTPMRTLRFGIPKTPYKPPIIK